MAQRRHLVCFREWASRNMSMDLQRSYPVFLSLHSALGIGFRQCTVLKLLFTFLALTAQRRHLQSAALQHRPRLQTGPSCCRLRPARPTAGTYPAAEDCTCRMQNAAQRCIKSRALTGMHPEELGVSSSQKIKLLELTVDCRMTKKIIVIDGISGSEAR